MRHSIPHFAKLSGHSRSPSETESFQKRLNEPRRSQKATETSRCFEYLIRKTQKLSSLNQTERDLILEDLNYFLKQSLTDIDRRHHTEILKNKWKAFEFKVHRTSLLKEPKGFSHPIQEIFGKPQTSLEDQKEIKGYDNLELPDFFKDLLFELQRKNSFLNKEEELLVFCGLKYLQSEARLPAMKQERKAIGKVWKGVRPVWERYGFFYRYVGAKSLSSKLKLFITGSL